MSLSKDSRAPDHRYRVLIADDHPIVRASVKCLLEMSSTISVVAEAQDGEEAWSKIQELKPDVAVIDVAMPKLNGIEVARLAAELAQQTRVLALTAWEDGRHARDSLAAGAAGFVPKSAAAADLIAAIHAVASGGHYVHPRVAGEVLSSGSRPGPDERQLNVREAEVLRLLALGLSNKEIASSLDVSVKTVETYKARGMEKIGATSRKEVVRFAVGRGWLSDVT